MNWQDIIDNAVQAKRHEEMKTSEQLTLGELLLKLEAVQDKNKPIIFNEQYHPSGTGSWRGSYCELAIEYEENTDPDFKPLTTEKWIAELKMVIGATYGGYKGGEFLMCKTTPVWVANYGETSGFTHDGDVWEQAVVGVSETDQAVILETKNIEY